MLRHIPQPLHPSIACKTHFKSRNCHPPNHQPRQLLALLGEQAWLSSLAVHRSRTAVHAPHCMGLRAQLVSLGPAVHQAALQDGSRARKEAHLCEQQWQGEWQGEGGHGLVPQPARGRGIGSSSSVINWAVVGSVQLCGGGGAFEIVVD